MSRIAITFSSAISKLAKVTRFAGAPAARKLLLASAAALPLAGPALAEAGHTERYDRGRYERYDDRRDRSRFDVDIHIGSRPEPRCEERRVRVWVPPVYRTVCDRRWVEPVYRTVCDRRWVEPVYQTTCDRVWVPDQYQVRESRSWDGCRWVVRCERVLVCAGHYEARERQVCVREGRWETFERQECVSPGRWDTCERQVCVSEGHYEWRTERVASDYRPAEVTNPWLAGGIFVNR